MGINYGTQTIVTNGLVFCFDVLDENNNYIDKSYQCTGDRNPCWHCNVYDGVLEK